MEGMAIPSIHHLQNIHVKLNINIIVIISFAKLVKVYETASDFGLIIKCVSIVVK